MNNNMNSKIKQMRLSRGLSQSQLAEKSNVSIKTIQKYESGERNINKARLDIVCKLAKALQCEITDLI
jgi:transcriptional regulator with XRE-family HTH domain